jgi:hypothetical protein
MQVTVRVAAAGGFVVDPPHDTTVAPDMHWPYEPVLHW